VELCTELFYAIIPTLFLCSMLICYPYLVSMLYADLLSLHLFTFLMFFILVHVTFFLTADACLSRKKNILAVWRLSGSVLSRCVLAPLGVFFVMKTLEKER